MNGCNGTDGAPGLPGAPSTNIDSTSSRNDAGNNQQTDAGSTTDAGPPDAGPPDAGPPDAGPPDAGPPDAGPQLCSAVDPTCQDQSVAQLKLFATVNSAAITEEGAAPNFHTYIDAVAGGSSPTQSYVYAKFTDKGLEKVEVGDQAALDSAEWDIAFRRFVIRLNSGVAGPSCVQGGEIKGKAFDEVTAWPDPIKLASEAYYDKACKLVEDDSGLPGAPATVLAKYWGYKSCVQMTGKTWGIQLANGKRVKLTVDGYYDAAAQETCNAKGSVPQGTAGGKIHLRWAFLP